MTKKLNANRFHYNATSRVTGCGTGPREWIFRRRGCYRAAALCRKHTQRGKSDKTAAHAGFLPNYPILGIGLTGGLAYSSTALNFPVQSVFLKPPDTAIRWLFLFARRARRPASSCADRAPSSVHCSRPRRQQRQFLRHIAYTAITPRAACGADLRPGPLQTIHKLRAIGIASKMLAHCVSRQPARCRNCIVRREMVLEPRIVQPQSASALHIRLYRSFKCRSTLSFPPRCAAACSPWPRWPPCRPSSWRLPVWRFTVTGSMTTLPST